MVATRDAYRVIEASFLENGRVVGLERCAYRRLLAKMAAEAIAGGRAYDAVIAECTLRERGVTLLTFNADDFAPFASRRLDIVVSGR
jgi:predicted nucleic acid-binding protein